MERADVSGSVMLGDKNTHFSNIYFHLKSIYNVSATDKSHKLAFT